MADDDRPNEKPKRPGKPGGSRPKKSGPPKRPGGAAGGPRRGFGIRSDETPPPSDRPFRADRVGGDRPDPRESHGPRPFERRPAISSAAARDRAIDGRAVPPTATATAAADPPSIAARARPRPRLDATARPGCRPGRPIAPGRPAVVVRQATAGRPGPSRVPRAARRAGPPRLRRRGRPAMASGRPRVVRSPPESPRPSGPRPGGPRSPFTAACAVRPAPARSAGVRPAAAGGAPTAIGRVAGVRPSTGVSRPERPPWEQREEIAPRPELLESGEELVAGRRPVEEAFVARRPAIRLLVVPQRRHALERLVLHATSLRIPIVEVEGGTLTALAGFDGHQGVALVVEPRRFASLDRSSPAASNGPSRRSSLSSTPSRTRRMSGRCSGAPRRPASTASSSRRTARHP